MMKYFNRLKNLNIKINTLNKKSFTNNLNNIKNGIQYLNQEQSRIIDEELMSENIGYSLDQLMEVAGLSVALAVDKTIKDTKFKNVKRILNISGPGNNGGDGLVASRYLKEFGYEIDILYPKRTDKELYNKLIKQCQNYSIRFVDENIIENLGEYDLIIDSIFGFSFKGELRSPFDKIITAMSKSNIKIASVDIPSGWDVEKGNINNTFTPDLLISLTLPKLSVINYTGIHYLGGRFVPKLLYRKLEIVPPFYNNSDLIILI